MKKITLLLAFLITSIGFSQELVTNGDFQAGTGIPANWYGNAANAVDLGGGNIVNQANVVAPGPAYTVNLSQDIVLENGKTYELNFDAWTDNTTGTRTMIVGVGQNNAPWSALTQTPILTAISQPFTYQFTINYGDGVGDRVLFDMGAETGYVFIDNVSVVEIVDLCNDGILNNGETEIDCGGPNCSACPSPPATAAPTPPARATSDVLSVFSGAYTNVTASGLNTFAGASWDNFTIESADDTRRLTAPNPGGGAQFEYIGVPPLDLSDYTHMHIDFYVEGAATPGSVFQIFLINFPNHPDGGGSYNLNTQFEITVVGAGAWVSGDIELSTFNNGAAAKDKIALVQVVAAGPAYGPIYIDNIYFHKNTTLGIEDFDKTSFIAYPNPTNDSWTVKTKNINIASVEVYDILGKNVLSLSPNASEVKIDATKLSKGLYFATIATEAGIESLKLIKN